MWQGCKLIRIRSNMFYTHKIWEIISNSCIWKYFSKGSVELLTSCKMLKNM